MPRVCTVCAHPDVFTINERLVGIGAKPSLRNIAKQFDLNYQAVHRHREHIPEMLSRASRAEEVAEADSLLERLESLHSRTEAILNRVWRKRVTTVPRSGRSGRCVVTWS
jgi:hypothetical protein